MPQTKYDAKITDKDRADAIKKDTGDIAGVKWVNINVEQDGSIVVTHGDDFDEDAFKAAAGI